MRTYTQKIEVINELIAEFDASIQAQGGQRSLDSALEKLCVDRLTKKRNELVEQERRYVHVMSLALEMGLQLPGKER